MAPSVTLLFGVSAKWTALVFLALQLLSCVAEHAWGQLIHSLASAGFAFGYVRLQQGRWVLPQVPLPAKKTALKVLAPVPVQKKAVPAQFKVVTEEPDALDSIDHLLEKIGRSGLASLTEVERTQLEAAREKLLRKETTRP
jgi:hypothetical protein